VRESGEKDTNCSKLNGIVRAYCNVGKNREESSGQMEMQMKWMGCAQGSKAELSLKYYTMVFHSKCIQLRVEQIQKGTRNYSTFVSVLKDICF